MERDLGKNLNSVVGLDEQEPLVMLRRVRRATIAELADNLPTCTVAMKACCGAHHVDRLFAAKGHEVRLLPEGLLLGYDDSGYLIVGNSCVPIQ